MAQAKLSPEILAHLEWLGFVQPTGLVVSAPALAKANAILDRHDIQGQLLLKECVAERAGAAAEEPERFIPDFETFARRVLGWSFSHKFYAGTAESSLPAELEIALPEYGETLRADYAVREPDPKEQESSWQLLVRVLEPGEAIDRVRRGSGRLEASEHGRMERLLRQTGVLAGLIFNGDSLRLIAAPRGESSGWLDFKVSYILTTAGRPICTAMRLLLSERRLLSLPRQERLTALLEDSRKYQNEVSERLAEQVLHALYELLRGFQAADDATKGDLLRDQLRERPDEVYHALLTVLLRLVFILYAEERDMLPEDETFVRYYSIAGLHERLREDAALYPDTMDQRFGAWAQLLTLFRMVHDGASAEGMHLPERHGVLFDPDRFPFLEGRTGAGARQIHERIDPPLVPDGTVFRALEKLLVLDGERISYRALDVEQIGSVYETMMGFRLETAHGRSLAIRPAKRLGAPVTIDLEELLTVAPEKREKWFAERADRKPAASVKQAMTAAATLEELHVALESAVDRDATPDVVPPGSMVLQPSEERRRSGSHYTPRSLTGPIVRTTLEPILQRFKGPNGEPPKPEQILDLKVCDPAMGSGAFLVESCRQLADALVEAWSFHGEKLCVPNDEDDLIFARRMIAQRCLYGVDRNPVAVDLAKMSLWLVTLAREHSLTFVDHALRHGDSLVGLSLTQIEAFHWDPMAPGFESIRVRGHLERVADLRDLIRDVDESITDQELRDLWDEVQYQLDKVRLLGDLVVAAFFEGSKPKDREIRRRAYADLVVTGGADGERARLEDWRRAEPSLVPFHWEVEFPEVFCRAAPGFDAVVGNPPFVGGQRITGAYTPSYRAWLVERIANGKHGSADLAAYFFLRIARLVRQGGTVGLFATNTISQGDTREVGLDQLVAEGNTIFRATSTKKWPGESSLEVAEVFFTRGGWEGSCVLDGKVVECISPFLADSRLGKAPVALGGQPFSAFKGSELGGDYFLISSDEAQQLIQRETSAQSYCLPFLNGDDLVSAVGSVATRHAIYFGSMTLEEATASAPHLVSVLRSRVPDNARSDWWRFRRPITRLYAALKDKTLAIVMPQTSVHWTLNLCPVGQVFSNSVFVCATDKLAAFSTLQSRVHEVWKLMYGPTLETRPRYSISDCLHTFASPDGWETDASLEAVGQRYYSNRADLMIRNNEGLTKTYNRFHDQEEDSPDILKLRELHEGMDRAVLDAYGWTDIPTTCEFLLDYEDNEAEAGSRRKPWRYRWPDDVRDEVLTRLLELNAQRAAEEALAGAGAKKGSRGSGSSCEMNPNAESLF